SFPFIPIYFKKQGLSLDVIGIIMGGALLLSALGNLIGGFISDELGRRRTMLSAITGRAVFTMLVAVSIHFSIPMTILVPILYINTLIGSIFTPALHSYIMKRLPFHSRNESFSALRVSMNIGWAAGPTIGGLLAPTTGYAILFFTTSLLTFVNLAIFKKYLFTKKRVFEPDQHTVRRIKNITLSASVWRNSLKNKLWVRFNLLIFVASMCVAPFMVFNIIAIYLSGLHGHGETLIGALFGLNGVLVILFQTMLTKHFKSRSLTSIISKGLILYALSFFLFGVAKSIPFFVMAMVILTFGEMIFSPAEMTLNSNLSTHLGGRDKKQATYVGMANFSRILAAFVGLTLGGYSMEYLGAISPILPWAISAVMVLIVSIYYKQLSSKIPSKELLGLEIPPPPQETITKNPAGN
ncbi:MFS transporter, partial [Elusimicrobiota bacterium]